MAAANSATANSATSGAPGPATGIPVSPNPRTWTVSATSSDSAGCMIAHATASSNRSASARSAAARWARAAANTAAGVSGDEFRDEVVMGLLKHSPPTVLAAQDPLSTRGSGVSCDGFETGA